MSALKQRVAPARAMAPLKPAVIRWAKWFLAAGWSPREVAHLFDLTTADLRLALGGSA